MPKHHGNWLSAMTMGAVAAFPKARLGTIISAVMSWARGMLLSLLNGCAIILNM